MKTITPTAIAVNTTVIEVPMLNAAPGLRVYPQRQAAAEQPDRRPVRQRGDHHRLGDDVRGQHGDRHGEQQSRSGDGLAGERGCQGCWPLRRAGQRRSSRCLQVTHRVARGNACRRALPIGSPHDSQVP